MAYFLKKIFFCFLIFNLFSFEQKTEDTSGYEDTYENLAEELTEENIPCEKGLYLMYNSSNCESMDTHKNYYLNSSDSKLYPCELFKDKHCYECDPDLLDYTHGICLSCIQGYEFNEMTKECEKCKENEFPIILNDFLDCEGQNENTVCQKYTTICSPLESETREIICPYEAPIFDNLTKSCYEFECPNEGLKKGNCYFQNIKYENKRLFINWFNNEPKFTRYPSYNIDNSGNLLIELTSGVDTPFNNLNNKRIYPNNERKFYFYNEDGRGMLDELNDISEKKIQYEKKIIRMFSISMAVKLNDSEEYRAFLNFENYEKNMEMYDLKTGEISSDNIFLIGELYYLNIENIKSTPIQMIELNEKNKYLIAGYYYSEISSTSHYGLIMFLNIFEITLTKQNNVNVYSLHFLESLNYSNSLDFDKEEPFYIIQTQKGNLIISVKTSSNALNLINLDINKHLEINTLFDKAFQKLLLLKDEIFILCYCSKQGTGNALNILTAEYLENNSLNEILTYAINIDIQEGGFYYSCDMILVREYKVAFVSQKMDKKRLSIYTFDFLDDYKNVIINQFKINIYEQTMNIMPRYSLLFKYKDLVGFQFENSEAENGFVLFGYYNSTDPRNIYNLKKDGFNYKIYLGNYLKLQSNVLGYQKKCIKIIQVPNISESGIYLVSNVTKNYVNKNDCIDLDTELYLSFAYNSFIKRGDYFFKFAGVLEEPTFELLTNEYSDSQNISNNTDEKYKEIFNERRNTNITGRVAFVQIHVLNDTKVFCDENYDNTSIKDIEGKKIACGFGKYFDVENANEITQYDLGTKYYFNKNNDAYIKCHEKCKRCSRLFNETNMNCDECYDNFFIRDENCIEISNCKYNYYYDNYNGLDLKCLSRGNYCPDFKPYENITTKECIEKCDIKEFNNICSPTTNPVSINETYKKIFENSIELNLENKLLVNKEKYIIKGNNVSFIFSTSEIEINELYDSNYSNSTSIILNECENKLKEVYSFKEPIPILKIEQSNNHSNNIELYYELFHPRNLSLKLDLNLCKSNEIEIRYPLALKEYKMNLVFKTSSLGYNIFDSNDSFYKDICSPFSYNNSDFSLSERKTLLDISDEKLCMDGCNQSDFDIITVRSRCICNKGVNVKDRNNFNEKKENTNINEEKIALNMIKKNMDFSKASNIKIVKCFSIIFTKKIFIENYGFYIMLFMNFFNIALFFCWPTSRVAKRLDEFCNKVLEQMEIVYNNNKKYDENPLLIDNDIVENNKENILNVNIKNNKEKHGKINHPKEKSNFNLKNKIYINNKNKKKAHMKTENMDSMLGSSKSNFNKKNDNSNKSKYIENFKKDLIFFEKNNANNIKKEDKVIENYRENNSDYYISCLIKNISFENRKAFLSESEIENLSYKDAREIENRNKSDYYFALLKEKNLIMSMLLNTTDYNISIVKVSLFVFNFNLTLTTNALFFDDEAIYEINQDQGYFNLSTQISRIIYSAIISSIINAIVEMFALSHEDIIQLRNYKDLNEAKKFIPNLIKKLKFKYVLYFGTTIFFNIVFFYYITAFCAIYSIIQTHMISDTLMSFLLTMSYSLILSMISSIIRISSLKKGNKVNHIFYILSWTVGLL